MKLEVGMYVRLGRNQGIAKIDEYDEEYNTYTLDTEIFDEWAEQTFRLDEDDVLKASHNIIDLIEIGDYVNGYKVINIGIEEDGHKYIDLDFDKENDALHWGKYGSLENEEDIKSIVTKEQFESMSYKVEG